MIFLNHLQFLEQFKDYMLLCSQTKFTLHDQNKFLGENIPRKVICNHQMNSGG